MSEKHAQERKNSSPENKISPRPPAFSLNDAVVSIDSKAVGEAIAALPQIDLNDIDIKKYKERGLSLVNALRQAVKMRVELSAHPEEKKESILMVEKRADQKAREAEKWHNALRVLEEFIQYFPIRVVDYIKSDKLDFFETYEHLAFDRIATEGSSALALNPINASLRTAFTNYRNDLKDKEILDALCFLIQTFRAKGWGREIVISDDPKKALDGFKIYLKSLSPEIEAALDKISSKDLNSALSQFIMAFRAGKAEDDAYLEYRDELADALVPYTPEVTARIIRGYAGFFGDHAKAAREAAKTEIAAAEPSNESEPKSLWSQFKSFICP